ncbi:terminase [Ruminococcus sp. AM42-11]|uniref:terminase n=1 Tax=Ruminococcus sp. AM42-11 TaxID=2292372 RepID=UPI001924C858|nr:terminase [Ruminococcus sp. AM42-11]
MMINPKAEKTINQITSQIDYSKYKLKQVSGIKKQYLNDIFDNNYKYDVYVKRGTYALSQRKIESLISLAEIQKYYQANPVKFIDDFFNIELLDAQAYIVQRAWMCPNVLLVCSRGFGKSTITDIVIMSKDMLFTNYWSYIASGSGSQAEQTFTTLEKLANDNIESMMGSTGYIFKNEVEIKNAAGDGFSHSSDGFSYSLYNGSMTKTLNSNVDKKRGARSNFCCFDECGFLDADMMHTYAAFVIVNKGFATGKDRDGNSIDINRLRAIPSPVQNQLFYISSASSVDTEFYKLYRDFSKRMIMGDTDYFVAQIDCEIVLKPTKHGKLIAPLYSKSTIEAAMRTNPEKALREYYCIFSTQAGSDAIIKRGVITRNEEVRKPLLYNDTGNKRFAIGFDPARSRDNSVITVGEIYDFEQVDGTIDKRMRIVNCVNLIDVGKKIKSPMQTPDQVKYLKQLILDYNGGADNYDNIVGVYIDAGSGGAGVNIADYLMEDWVDDKGIIHRGLIDKEYSAEYVKKFPNAVNKLHLMAPAAYKSEMYEAMIELMNQDKISFTASYDNKDYLSMFDIDEKLLKKEKTRIISELKKQKLNEEEFEKQLREELSKVQSVKTKIVKLDWADKLALTNIDALKEELVNMVRKKRESGKDSFELSPEKANKMHDDRSYTACLISYALMQERRKSITGKKKKSTSNLADILPIRTAKRHSYFD